MIQQVTCGIKISVETKFEQTINKDLHISFAFIYKITIENLSNDIVQLKSRFWEIKDSLNDSKIVSGEGVVGHQPILKPGKSHSYFSGCLLSSTFGSMKGYYNMLNYTTSKPFKVYIPNFKLFTPFSVN